MQTLIYLVIALSVLISIHEFGHYLAAKFFKVNVETFSIGFGQKLFKFNCWNTEFAVSLIPLGGYVKMAGENPDEPAKNPDDFYAKPPWQRIVIAAAGPSMNLILAIFLFVAVYSIGRYVPTYQLEMAKVGTVLSKEVPLKPGDIIISANGNTIKNWQEFTQIVMLNPNKNLNLKVKRNGKTIDVKVHTGLEKKNGIGTLDVVPAIKPIVGRVVPSSPAKEAGLKAGDIILTINGRDITNWRQVVKTISESRGKPIHIKILRNGKPREITVTPEFNKKFKRYTIGIVPKLDVTFIKYSLPKAAQKGVEEFKSQTTLFFKFLYKLITGQASLRSLGGPIMIAKVAGEAAAAGISSFLYFMGFISLQLGYFNLLPLPVLDGGLIFTFLVEMLRRRPLSTAFRERVQQVGFAILAFLMVVVFYNDIMRLLR